VTLRRAAKIDEKDLKAVLDDFQRAGPCAVHLLFDPAQAGGQPVGLVDVDPDPAVEVVQQARMDRQDGRKRRAQAFRQHRQGVVPQIEIDVVGLYSPGIGDNIVHLPVMGHGDRTAPDRANFFAQKMASPAPQDEAEQDDVDRVEVFLAVDVAGEILRARP